MSVVNDILKDLHQRRGQHQYMPNIPLDFEDGDIPKFKIVKRLTILIFIMIAIGISFYLLIFSLQAKKEMSTLNEKESIEYKAKIKGDMSSQKANYNSVESTNHALKTKAVYSMQMEEMAKQPLNHQPIIPSLIDNKHSDSKPEETNSKDITTGIVKSKSTSATNSISSETNNHKIDKKPVVKLVTNDELLIRKLMVSNPEKVWPHIKKLLPKSNDKTSLIALGAQGEQRSKNHQNAIDLYKTLSEVEPSESKWRVGSAISYDALSKYEEALLDYEKSLKLNSLPAPLYSFVKQRIAQLTGIKNER